LIFGARSKSLTLSIVAKYTGREIGVVPLVGVVRLHMRLMRRAATSHSRIDQMYNQVYYVSSMWSIPTRLPTPDSRGTACPDRERPRKRGANRRQELMGIERVNVIFRLESSEDEKQDIWLKILEVEATERFSS